MRNAFARLYGSHPLHLLTMIAGFAVLGYVVATVKPATLWNPDVWWQSIVVWFAGAVVAHDLVLFPVYAGLDRLLSRRAPRPVPTCPCSTISGCPRWGRASRCWCSFPASSGRAAPRTGRRPARPRTHSWVGGCC
ncbi:putative conserved transmembrane protein [Mycobacterium intracellulare]|nr:putative conserved transmembrane protein [Mycobacterium intracellulare]